MNFLKVNPWKQFFSNTFSVSFASICLFCSWKYEEKTFSQMDPNGGFVMVLYPGEKEEKKNTSPQNQTNPKNISTCWIFCSTLKHTKRALPSDMILRIKMTWNANPLKLPRSKWKNWDMSLLHSLGLLFLRGKISQGKMVRWYPSLSTSYISYTPCIVDIQWYLNHLESRWLATRMYWFIMTPY